eukprot:TRINITY_DN10170_c0_g4_i1.p1 TRINITY_DN10170_c0_g4~~TRINITY_DN10170_c0_g4_i1.p1  ORF type:complete len:328 (-),score=36.11 TRINITY_DN10170_c0_g4_i1:46-1029(-)
MFQNYYDTCKWEELLPSFTICSSKKPHLPPLVQQPLVVKHHSPPHVSVSQTYTNLYATNNCDERKRSGDLQFITNPANFIEGVLPGQRTYLHHDPSKSSRDENRNRKSSVSPPPQKPFVNMKVPTLGNVHCDLLACLSEVLNEQSKLPTDNLQPPLTFHDCKDAEEMFVKTPSLNESVTRPSWLQRYNQLKDFKIRYGHCKVPYRWMEDPGLGRWVSLMRRRYKEGILDSEKISMLDKISFSWNLTGYRTRLNKRMPDGDAEQVGYVGSNDNIENYSKKSRKRKISPNGSVDLFCRETTESKGSGRESGSDFGDEAEINLLKRRKSN